MWGTRTVDVVGTVFPSSRPRLNAGHRLPLAGGARRRAEYSAESAVENVVKLAESYDDALVVKHKIVRNRKQGLECQNHELAN